MSNLISIDCTFHYLTQKFSILCAVQRLILLFKPLYLRRKSSLKEGAFQGNIGHSPSVYNIHVCGVRPCSPLPGALGITWEIDLFMALVLLEATHQSNKTKGCVCTHVCVCSLRPMLAGVLGHFTISFLGLIKGRKKISATVRPEALTLCALEGKDKQWP